ncbi:protein lifeguard 1-like [Melanaphis sacchari]|uniref:protein lifeguard 1-like n=1 Tax=Melanaphis sacchari TaxID=742174 RepID=UPI000DC14DCC|nr:protein lifeguard 1-like [Melanaphis sacchari]
MAKKEYQIIHKIIVLIHLKILTLATKLYIKTSFVYSIVMCNLLITLMIVTMASFYGETKHFIKKNQWFNTIACLIVFGILIARFWFVELYRKSPFNFILLFVFTLAESVTKIFFSYQYAEQNDIIMASGLMILICFALIIIASLTKIEFTVKGCFLLIAAIIPVIILSAFIVSIFFPDILITFISASLQAIIFSSFLIYDTQKIISGNHKYSISPKEYIFTALTILLDFIIFCLAILLLILIGAFLLMIFMFIIQLIMKNE